MVPVAVERIVHACGFQYHDASSHQAGSSGDVPSCGCGTFAIGSCKECGKPVCGDHSALRAGSMLRVCSWCEETRFAAELEARATLEVEAKAARLEREHAHELSRRQHFSALRMKHGDAVSHLVLNALELNPRVEVLPPLVYREPHQQVGTPSGVEFDGTGVEHPSSEIARWWVAEAMAAQLNPWWTEVETVAVGRLRKRLESVRLRGWSFNNGSTIEIRHHRGLWPEWYDAVVLESGALRISRGLEVHEWMSSQRTDTGFRHYALIEMGTRLGWAFD